MPRDKDRKRIIRARMKKTGESYTAARAHVISSAQPKPQSRGVDYAALAGMSDAVIAAKTGYTWREWERVLDADNAAAMAHRDIAKLVHEKHGIGSWWTQSVTVGYERIKGLRERGQQRSGEYEASKSKTLNVPVDVVFEAWADQKTRRRWLRGVEPRVRTATASRSMRLSWTDGTIVAVWFQAKGRAKSVVGVQHTKLPDRAAVDRVKREWAAHLDALASLIAR
jgi:uncharacterized protein YndB with AHSA1/START domain